MNDTELEILVDFGTLPRDVGLLRQDHKRIFQKKDIPNILHWVDKKIGMKLVANEKRSVAVHVTGQIPAWLGLQLGVHLKNKADKIIVSAPNMPAFEIIGVA